MKCRNLQGTTLPGMTSQKHVCTDIARFQLLTTMCVTVTAGAGTMWHTYSGALWLSPRQQMLHQNRGLM